MDYELPTPKAGETYGTTCDRLEKCARDIITARDHSEEALRVLAYVLTEAPSDFDDSNTFQSFREGRKFLSTLDNESRNFFRTECYKLPRAQDPRIDFLLSKA